MTRTAELHAFLVDAKALAVLADPDRYGAAGPIELDPVAVLLELGLSSASTELPFLVEANGFLDAMQACIVVDRTVPSCNAALQLVASKSDERRPVQDHSAGSARQREEGSAALVLTAKTEEGLE